MIKIFEKLIVKFKSEPKSERQSWAEREIEIACKRERAANENPDGIEWDYGCACYESALKAYQSLMGDGHSGFSIGMTKHILNRLIDGRPLTPIEDTDDVWNDISEYRPEEGYTDYQCKRMSSLFKYVYDDGTIKYKDIDSHYCVDIESKSTYHSSLVQRLMDEMFPTSMPYMPTEPTKVYCSELLTDRKNGDFDTVAIWHMIKPSGDRIEICRYFKEGEEDWVEINKAEYLARKEMDAFRAKYEEENKAYMPEFLKKKFNVPDEMKAVGPEVVCGGNARNV